MDELREKPGLAGLAAVETITAPRVPPNDVTEQMRREWEERGALEFPHLVEKELDFGEVLLLVQVNHQERNAMSQMFWVPASFTLDVLLRRMSCISNEILDGKQTLSAFLFIESVFYEMDRVPPPLQASALPLTSYAEGIIEWMREEKRFVSDVFGVARRASASTTTFADLRIRLGKSYLWQHQGSCCHEIRFVDMRRVVADDPRSSLCYPYLVFTGRSRRPRCHICKRELADFVVYGDKPAPVSPCHMCSECYQLLHYGPDGHMLYSDFQVFPVWQD